jgi:23S rRNA (adenine2503-C2)-methyltransferase
LRNELVPINRKYNLQQFIDSAASYIDKMPDNRRKATVEYTLMDQVNDRTVHARELAVLLKDLPCKINLIPFNPFPGSEYKRVTNTALNRFRDILAGEGYTVTVRTTRGDDIAAACGQLAGEVNDKTRRQERYKKRLEEVQSVKIIE